MTDLIAVPSGFSSPEIQARYERYMRDHFGELDVPNLCETIATWAYRKAVDDMVTFNDLPGTLARVQNQLTDIRQRIDEMGQTP